MVVQIRFEMTPEGTEAVTDAAEKLGTTRGRYLQDVMWEAVQRDSARTDRERVFPTYRRKGQPHMLRRNHRTGTHGRWAKHVRNCIHAHSSAPSLLYQIAQETGDLSIAGYVRRNLKEALKRDIGRDIEMPRSIKDRTIFNRVIEEVR